MSVVHVTRFEWIRYLSNELGNDERRRLEGHSSVCGECAEALQALRRVQQDGLRLAPGLSVPKRQPWMRRWSLLMMPAAATAAVVLAFWISTQDSPRYAAKGAVHVSLSCKYAEVIWACRSGERVRPGTAVMVGVDLDSQAYLLLVGYDGVSYPTVLFPHGAHQAQRVEAGANPLGKQSLVLDAQPTTEHFFLLASSEVFSARDVLEIVRRTAESGAVSWPGGIEATHFFFAKEVSQNGTGEPLIGKGQPESEGLP